MAAPRSTALRGLSPLARTALASLAIGFLAAILSVQVVQQLVDVMTRNAMYVEEDVDTASDDVILNRNHHGDDTWPWQSIELPGLVDQGKEVEHDDVIARSMSSAVKVFCFVMTTSESVSRAASIKATWGRRCNDIIFMSNREHDVIDGVPAVRVDSASRTAAAFDFVFANHANDADWFLQVDDQTFIIMENLRYFLSSMRPSDPIYFRHHFSAATQRGYLGSGSGYIVSKEALRRFGNRSPKECPINAEVEDREMGRCLRGLGVKTGDSRDALGRSRFHCFTPEMHVQGGFPGWYTSYNKDGVHAGIESISDYAISFHFVTNDRFPELEYYIYHMRPYGRVTGLLKLNRSPDQQQPLQHQNKLMPDVHAPDADGFITN